MTSGNGRIGLLLRCCQLTNPTNAAIPITNGVMTTGSVHPSRCDSISAYTVAASPPPIGDPGDIDRAPSTGPDIGHSRNVSAYPSAIGIADNTKIQRQPRKSTQIPPEERPNARRLPSTRSRPRSPRTSVVFEHRIDQRQRTRHEERRTQALDEARGDQHRRRGGNLRITEPAPKANSPNRITGTRPNRPEMDPPGRIAAAIANR